ncbi:MAG: endonuclease [Parcubacteria group bacterium]|nr:endonuclease [Parcubacteria group bacterium]
MPDKCRVCLKETERAGYIYCSNTCQMGFQHEKYIQDWKVGKESGLIAMGVVSLHVKRYLREKYGNKCCICEWSMTNPKSGVVPLVADHIDGNWRNNSEENLRLVCPNCDALSPTYAALNKGKGRPDRVISKRVQEAGVAYRKRTRKDSSS